MDATQTIVDKEKSKRFDLFGNTSSQAEEQISPISMVNSDNRGQVRRKIEEGRRKIEGRRSDSICLATLKLKDGKSALVYGHHCRIQSVLRVLLEHDFDRQRFSLPMGLRACSLA